MMGREGGPGGSLRPFLLCFCMDVRRNPREARTTRNMANMVEDMMFGLLFVYVS